MKADLNEYITTVKLAIKDFINALHHYDLNRNIPGHNAEHITYTNKLNPSRDVGLKFAKQSMVRHVLEGGSWLNKDGIREKTTEDVMSFIQTNESMFYLNLLGGSREFIDNTDPNYKKITEGCLAVFKRIPNSNDLLNSGHPKSFASIVQWSNVLLVELNERTLERGYLLAQVDNTKMVISQAELEVEGVLNAYKQVDDTFRYHQYFQIWFLLADQKHPYFYLSQSTTQKNAYSNFRPLKIYGGEWRDDILAVCYGILPAPVRMASIVQQISQTWSIAMNQGYEKTVLYKLKDFPEPGD
ncbi:uncharacterized protein EV154DRAFT_562855 [Mucor mucedo]|uniref:uncharacterized protein n=1 Tax=Mucor mucedo TaxID=29922 RepID=UPI002220599E|nr:uncharacterized protein EV154DRAFT_562855 [Mucor mucedo]KAI7891993.1 hypothetical protein EV154DRAFT_562855 [Mucor mucedo]